MEKYGIALIKNQRIGTKIVTTKTVMQFGHENEAKAYRVLNLSLKHIDRMSEMLYTFSYPEELAEALEIGETVPEFCEIDSPVKF